MPMPSVTARTHIHGTTGTEIAVLTGHGILTAEINMTDKQQRSDKPQKAEHSDGTPEARRELDPRAELGLKSPVKSSEDEQARRQEVEGKKATQFDGNPSPQGAPSSPFKPEDDTPAILKKTKGPRDDQ